MAVKQTPEAKAAADKAAGEAKDKVTEPTEETSAAGAKVEIVTVEEIVPEAGSEYTMEAVAVAAGTFGPGGIAPIGSSATINCSAYSSNWMKPKTKADAIELARYRKSLLATEKDATA